MATLVQMLQTALESRDPLLPNETKRVILKEALQAYVLEFLYNHKVYQKLNFYGGTCLHVVYNLHRLSEDIDLDNQEAINLDKLADGLIGYIHAVWNYREATLKEQASRQDIRRLTLHFPVLQQLGLSPVNSEALHLKLEISHHKQVAITRNTPVIFYGRSFVTQHFSLETLMAGKILACLERSFQVGNTASKIKGRDWYDLLWFMHKRIIPLEEKLLKDGKQPYTIQAAFETLSIRAAQIESRDLALDLLPLFEQRTYIENWITAFQPNFQEYVKYYEASS